MLRAVILQMWNRKRSNISLVVELICVFCLVWFITDYLFVYAYNCSLPDHRDLKHTWKINFALYPEDHPKYHADENEPDALLANFNRFLQTLRNYPGIEAVAVCHDSAIPASTNYRGRAYYAMTDTANIVSGQVFASSVEEDFFRVFGYTRDNGRTAASMQDFDWGDPKAIVLSRSAEQKLFPNGHAVGSELVAFREPDDRYKVVGVVDDIKRFDYERPNLSFYLPYNPVSPDVSLAIMLQYGTAVSVRAGASIPDNLFRAAFEDDMTDALQIGNFYLNSIVSYKQIEEDSNFQIGITNDLRRRFYLMTFFLLNILLCVMGTFWYRINLRRGEIGLRKALGSTSHSIRNLFFLEGLILLGVAALVGMAIEVQVIKADLVETLGQSSDIPTVYLPDRTALRFLITNALTTAIMAAVILSAIWLPAKRAASVPPVEALRDE
jgi:hypothetical protein